VKTMNLKFCKTQRTLTQVGSQANLSGRQRAFTIVEVVVAVFILGIACISLYAGFATGFLLVDSTRQELRATQILTQKAEALRLCTWSSLTNFPLSFSESYDPTSPNAGVLYVGTVTTDAATAIPNSSAYRSNMCTATINLYWTNYSGTRKIVHNRASQTLIARYGIQNYIWGN
jgi:prepilin-type N-terminal cleavage/methylation domain-containing protein